MTAEALESRCLLTAIPLLESNPGAAASLYLDFDGHFEPSWGAYSNVSVPAFDLDGDPNSVSSDEAQYIEEVFKVVAEDFAPFQVNVTTIEPPVLAAGVPADQANGVALRVAIGAETVFDGPASGIAYRDSFTNSIPNVAFVFTRTTNGLYSSKTTGDWASHEAGHSFGLAHFSNVGDLSAGWQAIMNSFHVGVGEAYWATATNAEGAFQDDLATIARPANGFGYTTDDHGDTPASASALADQGTLLVAAGVVGVNGDRDVFWLNPSHGNSLEVSVDGNDIGQNLDVVVDILTADGTVIATVDPADSDDAVVVVQAGNYLAVRSTGAYGRTGRYTITARESQPGLRIDASSPLRTSESGAGTAISVTLASQPAADVVIPVTSSDPGEGAVSTPQLTFTPANWFIPQVITVTGVDDGTVDGPVDYTIAFGPAASVDPVYAGWTLAPLTAINADNDLPGWAFQLSSETGSITPVDLKVDSQGNVVVTGTFTATADFDPGPGATNLTSQSLRDGFLAKYSPTRELLWARRFGGVSGLVTPAALELDSSDRVYLVGTTSSDAAQFGQFSVSNDGGTDAFLARLDPGGNFELVKSWGGTGSVQVNALAIDPQGVLHLAGSFSGTEVDLDPGPGTFVRTNEGGVDGYVSRLSSDGEFQSATTFGGAESLLPRALAIDGNGNEYVAALFYGTVALGSQTLSSVGANDFALFQINDAGNIAWARQAAAAGLISVARLAAAPDGTIHFASHFSGDIVFGDGAATLTSTQTDELFFTRWDAQGVLLRTEQFAGAESATLRDLEIAADGSLALVASIRGVADVDPGSGVVLAGSELTDSDFLLRLTADYQFRDVASVTRESGAPRALALGKQGDVYALGSLSIGSATMPNGETFTNSSGTDAYVLKLAKSADIILGGTHELVTTESGTTASFEVALNIPPTDQVTISVTSLDATEGLVEPAILTFTPENWNQPQIVTVTGVDDASIDGDREYSITLEPSSNSDTGYDGLGPRTILVANVDDDEPVALFADSFESGEWAGLWVEDQQNDWFRSSQRATEGSRSAEVDGRATNASLTLANPIDLTAYADVELTFSWYLESSWDNGEYIALELFDGSSWTEVRRLRGNADTENVWHDESLTIASRYLVEDFRMRFRASVSGSDEDGNVDNVRLIAYGLASPPPVASDDQWNAMEDGHLDVSAPGVLVGDSDPDGELLTAVLVDDASHGVLTLLADGSFQYTPDPDFSGTDVFRYRASDGAMQSEIATVTINVIAVNDAPIAAEDSFTISHSNVTISAPGVLNNDREPDGSAMTAMLVSGPSHGSLSLGSDGSFSYVAADGFQGTDTFSYQATDGELFSEPVSVTIQVTGATTKFYVPNDGASGRTFEYGAGGESLEDYRLADDNTAPRGAASTAEGSKIWVIDANRRVFVYGPDGELLGSWSANSLSSRATVQGIATDGTDVWIVDSRSDRVYRYANAAGRLSGSQSAASNFSLNRSNSNATGITTDGNYLWLVNDSSTDRVFKYTLGGSLVGNWTIDTNNRYPSGLTIDPSNESQDIWIVDRGNDQVFQYSNARSRNSGGLNAASYFELAAANTDPQGIADPPTLQEITSTDHFRGGYVDDRPHARRTVRQEPEGHSKERINPRAADALWQWADWKASEFAQPSSVRDSRDGNLRRADFAQNEAFENGMSEDFGKAVDSLFADLRALWG